MYLPRMDDELAPAILIANGRARHGTLVQVQWRDAWMTGHVASLDFDRGLVEVALDSGDVLHLDPGEVHRQFPQAIPWLHRGSACSAEGKVVGPAAGLKCPPVDEILEEHRRKCLDCQGAGQRRGLRGLSAKMKACRTCGGSGRVF